MRCGDNDDVDDDNDDDDDDDDNDDDEGNEDDLKQCYLITLCFLNANTSLHWIK